jgi:hypothetical protein
MNMFLVAAVIWGILFGGTCAVIAPSRNRNGGEWFVWGVIFGIFALVVLIVLPPIATTEGPAKQSQVSNSPPKPAGPARGTRGWYDRERAKPWHQRDVMSFFGTGRPDAQRNSPPPRPLRSMKETGRSS